MGAWVLPLVVAVGTPVAVAGSSNVTSTATTGDTGTQEVEPAPNDARNAEIQGGGGCLELPTAAAASVLFLPLLFGLRRREQP